MNGELRNIWKRLERIEAELSDMKTTICQYFPQLEKDFQKEINVPNFGTRIETNLYTKVSEVAMRL